MTASGVVLVQHLPASATIQSMTDSLGGTCTQSKGILNATRFECRVGTLLPGQSWTVIVEVAPSASSAKAAARVVFQGRDPNPANNYALVLMPHEVSTTGSGGTPPPPVRPTFDPNVRRRVVGPRPLPEL
jgi:hypothetical protein